MSLKIDQNTSIQGKHKLPIVADFMFQEHQLNSPIVIFCHGYKGFKDWGAWPLMCQAIVKQGYFVVAFNFSHNGGTIENPIDFPNLEAFGNDNFSKQQDDLQSVIDAVTDKNFEYSSHVNTANLTLIGHSRGGGAAIIKTANEAKVSKLITLAAISTYETSFPNYIKNKIALDISVATKKISVPHLIVHGTSDSSVPIESAEKLGVLNPTSESYFLDSDHVFGCKHPWDKQQMSDDLRLVTQKIISFLEK